MDSSSLSSRLVVFKLGGSLLSVADVAERLRRLIQQYSSERILIVVGGGASVDVVRDWSHRFALTEEAAHWIAIRSLSVTRLLIKTLLPECPEVVDSAQAYQCWTHGALAVLLDVESCLRLAEALIPLPLPQTWNVTSDSIAAWVASRWSADELILLKSADLADGLPVDEACRRNLVDEHFAAVAVHVRQVKWCNLLDGPLRVQAWLKH